MALLQTRGIQLLNSRKQDSHFWPTQSKRGWIYSLNWINQKQNEIKKTTILKGLGTRQWREPLCEGKGRDQLRPRGSPQRRSAGEFPECSTSGRMSLERHSSRGWGDQEATVHGIDCRNVGVGIRVTKGIKHLHSTWFFPHSANCVVDGFPPKQYWSNLGIYYSSLKFQ